MVIVQLIGGLGNQMFQYAAGRSLSLRLGVPLKLDLGWFRGTHTGIPREYALGDFPIQASIAKDAEIASLQKHENRRINRRLRGIFGDRGPWRRIFIKEPYFHYWQEVKRLKGPVYLEGYWQSERYFVDHSCVIRNDFSFPPLPTGRATALAEEIRSAGHSVAIHIRRGDYISSPEASVFHGICPSEYYLKALNSLARKYPLSLFLFSDEPNWVQKSFDTAGHFHTIVDLRENAVHDMHLMSLCRHHIIANSSFSWWGAWLSAGEGITCAPKRWFLEPSLNTQDLIPQHWLLLE